MRIHTAAKAIPEMLPDEYSALKADIESRGLLVPIETFNGQLLDGRHRFRACKELGIEPDMVEVSLDGMSPAEYVWSVNGIRRHLTPSQRAAVAVELLPELRKAGKERQRESGGDRKTDNKKIGCPNIGTTDPGKSTKQAAALVGVSHGYVSDAQKLKAELPETFQAVKDGKTTLAEAKKELRKQTQAKHEAALAAAAGDSREWTVTKDQAVVRCAVLVTDPPYGILDQEWEPDNLESATRDWLVRWNECGAELILSFFSQRYLWDAKAWFDECLANYTFQQLLVWHYPNNKSPQSRKGFKQTWEPIFFYRRTDSERQIVVGGTTWGDGLNDFDCHVAAVPQSNFNDADCKVHPAQKPVSVMRWLVNAATQPGDMIVDPFCGSGTTGIAAQQLGRRFHGIETDSAMAKTARRRIKAYGIQRP